MSDYHEEWLRAWQPYAAYAKSPKANKNIQETANAIEETGVAQHLAALMPFYDELEKYAMVCRRLKNRRDPPVTANNPPEPGGRGEGQAQGPGDAHGRGSEQERRGLPPQQTDIVPPAPGGRGEGQAQGPGDAHGRGSEQERRGLPPQQTGIVPPAPGGRGEGQAQGPGDAHGRGSEQERRGPPPPTDQHYPPAPESRGGGQAHGSGYVPPDLETEQRTLFARIEGQAPAFQADAEKAVAACHGVVEMIEIAQRVISADKAHMSQIKAVLAAITDISNHLRVDSKRFGSEISATLQLIRNQPD